jgi:hypothetical protein
MRLPLELKGGGAPIDGVARLSNPLCHGPGCPRVWCLVASYGSKGRRFGSIAKVGAVICASYGERLHEVLE